MADNRRSRSARVRVRAFAKLNLALRVLGARADGYHELRTTFQSVALHDTMTVTPLTGDFAIVCDDPHCPADASNLVWRAAERLWRETGRRGTLSGVRIDLAKRIPIGAGLGGGSSDAAAALRALAVLWRVRQGSGRLCALAREIGADVPYFLEGGTVLGLERGDLLFPLIDRPASWVVLALPDFGVSTKEAFGWWDQAARSATPAGFDRRSISGGGAAPSSSIPDVHSRQPSFPAHGRDEPCRDTGDDRRNDLEAPVAARHPEIGRLVSRLRRAGATHAAMSGSGSAVFGLFEVERRARAAAARMEGAGVRAIVTVTLARDRYRRLSTPRSTRGLPGNRGIG